MGVHITRIKELLGHANVATIQMNTMLTMKDSTMKALTSTLFRPYAFADHPFLSFLFFFLAALGFVHGISDISTALFRGIFVDGPRMTGIIFIVSLLISAVRYYEQKKNRNESTQ